MDAQTVGILAIVVLLVLMFLGMHIGFAMFAVGVAGMFLIIPTKAVLSTISTEPFGGLAHYTLSTIPMFALMGFFTFYGEQTKDIFEAARRWAGRFPGGLAMTSVIGCTCFAFCSGSSLASAAVMGKVIVPEMLRHGYDKRFAAGTVAASGTLAAMIPPSIILILYGIITEQSIAKILIAGIIPGIISALIYMSGIFVIARWNPGMSPSTTRGGWKERLIALKGVWGIVILAFLVLGGIYTGLFSPTEAGAAGAMGALLLGVASRRMNLAKFWMSLMDTATMTAQIFIIIAGALMFARLLTFSRLPYALVNWVLHFQVSPHVILLGVMGLYIILGTFMEPLGMMFITLPIIFPVITALGFNPIWFGILIAKTIEIGVITPPVGMNVYALKSAVPQVSLEDIFKGISWFLVMDILTLGLLLAVPSIATFLPDLMK
ncbi:MAG: TRAP transporter large permease [Desulfobacterales bacterium]|nr:MAG: TRAP transporter large permease [Desulfobacterales bacterium]